MRHNRRFPYVARVFGDCYQADYSPGMEWLPTVKSIMWLYLRAMYELQQARAKLKRAAKLLEPVAFVATYPNGSYVFDPEWSEARARFHKKHGATIRRIRGVIEPW